MSLETDNLTALLPGLQKKGLSIRAQNGKLKVSGPPEIVQQSRKVLSARKEEILNYLSRPSPSDIQSHEPRPDYIPPSSPQLRLLFVQEIQPKSWVFNIPFALDLEGLLDIPALQASLDSLVQRHEVLRTSFHNRQGKFAQEIHGAASVPLEIKDYRNEADASEKVYAAAQHNATLPFNISEPPLLRVSVHRLSDQKFTLLFNIHHLIADAWSLEILLREIILFYRAHLLGKQPDFPALPFQYADYTLWQQEWINSGPFQKQLDYWKQELDGDLPTLDLPTDFPRARVQNFEGDLVPFTIPEPLTNKLRQLSRDHSSSLFMTLLAAFNVLLRRYSGKEDLLIGCPIANRHFAEVEGLIGFFVNTLVLRTRIRPEASFLDLLSSVRDTTLSAYENQDVPFEKLVEILKPERDLSRGPLFDVKFQLEQAPESELSLPGLKLHRQPQVQIAAKHDLALDLYETNETLVGGFEYNSSLFKRETVERFCTHFLTLLESILAAPDQALSSLVIFPETEEKTYRLTWNTHDIPFQDSACYHHLFEAQVQRSPEATAVIFDDGNEVQSLTYQELNTRSNQLAHHLIDRGLGPENVVAIALARSPNLVIALLAVFKVGAAYLPLDQNYPAERLRFLLEDSRASGLITTSSFDLAESPCRIDLDHANFSDNPLTSPKITMDPDHLAYLIYTSGSAGKPKGVLVPHRGLVNLTEDKIRVCEIRPGDCVIQFFSFSFDGSVPEFVMSLAAGASLLLAPARDLIPGPTLKDLLVRHQVTHLTITPSALTALPHHNYPCLRMVLVGGEAPSPELVETWSGGRKFINGYGPTETTVNASMVTCGNGHPVTPTVTPSANKQLYILDKTLEITPIGVVGELHIGGIGIARGYHRQAALTAERFIPNPFTSQKKRPYNIPLLYKTGDLASYLPDGRIRVQGRADHQTKIRGYRIEIPEIERVLESQPEVKHGLVVARESPGGSKRLIAFAIPKQKNPCSPKEIRNYLAEKLPSFMLPSSFIWLEKFPLTPNGKLDESALPEAQNESARPKIAPRNKTEIILAEIFCTALEVDDVGIDDNFFELGGHSLLATQIISRIAETFSVEISVIDLFDAPAIEPLARLISSRANQETLAALINSSNDDEEREEFSF